MELNPIPSTQDDLTVELKYLEMKYGDRQYIPGMEGFFSRIFGTVFNLYRDIANYFSDLGIQGRELFRQDWVKYGHVYLERIGKNMPSDEQFSGTVSWYSDKHTIDLSLKNIKAMIQLNLNLAKVISNPADVRFTPEQQQVKHALDDHHCDINFEKPGKSKCANRTTFGQMGRIGNQGYGSSCASWLQSANKNLDEYALYFNEILAGGKMKAAIVNAQKESEAIYKKMSQMGDKEKLRASKMADNIRYRLMAYKAINKAGYHYWDNNLLMAVLLPAQNLGRNVGKMDDLTSWILSTKKSKDDGND